MSSVEKGKRSRSANYTHAEKNLLLNIVFKYKGTIESKKTDAVTWREKEGAWRRVADVFNANSRTGTYRDVNSLKKSYDNIKKTTRKKAAEEKVSMKLTGGGHAEINDDPNMNLALNIINRKTIYGLNNPYDVNENIEVDDDRENSERCPDETNEEIFLKIVDDNEEYEVDWGDFKAENLKTPVNPKLIPQSKLQYDADVNMEIIDNSSSNLSDTLTSQASKNIQVPKLSKSSANEQTEKLFSTNWTSRNRPVISTLPSSELSKKYNKLADVKIEIAELELEKVRYELQLQQKSLELDVEIKKKYLQKLEETGVKSW